MNRVLRTEMREWIGRGVRFFKEVRAELAKVTWPPRKGVIGSTAVVIVTVFIVSFFLGLVDVVLQQIMSVILR